MPLEPPARRGVPRPAQPEPLELDDTRVVAAGTALWLVALVVLLVAAAVGADVHGWWIALCACGVLLGVTGLRAIARRRQALARRRRGAPQRS